MKTSDGGESWQNITTTYFQSITCLSILDEENIWIGAGEGAIYFTSDLGTTWIVENLNSFAMPWITTIQFVDKFNGWAGTHDPMFFRTRNSGNHWKEIKADIFFGFLGIQTFFFADQLNGWLASVSGYGEYAIANTTDGGETWEYLPGNAHLSRISSFFFMNKNLGWAAGGELINTTTKGVILRYKIKE